MKNADIYLEKLDAILPKFLIIPIYAAKELPERFK